MVRQKVDQFLLLVMPTLKVGLWNSPAKMFGSDIDRAYLSSQNTRNSPLLATL